MLFQTRITPKQTTYPVCLGVILFQINAIKRTAHYLRVQSCIIRTYFLIWNLTLMMNQTSYHSLPEYNSLPESLLLYW